MPNEYTLEAALRLDTQDAFQNAVEKSLPRWMLKTRLRVSKKNKGLLPPFMPHTFSKQGETVRQQFVRDLRTVFTKVRPEGAHKIATGMWQLPCGITANSAWNMILSLFDEQGISWDQHSAKMACIKAQKEAQKPIVFVKKIPPQAGTCQRPPSANRNSQPNRRKVTENAACPYESHFDTPENYLQQQREILEYRYVAWFVDAVERREAHQQRQQQRREALLAEVTTAAENRAHRIYLGTRNLLMPMGPRVVFVREPIKDAHGRIIRDKNGQAVAFKIRMIDAVSSSHTEENQLVTTTVNPHDWTEQFNAMVPPPRDEDEELSYTVYGKQQLEKGNRKPKGDATTPPDEQGGGRQQRKSGTLLNGHPVQTSSTICVLEREKPIHAARGKRKPFPKLKHHVHRRVQQARQ